MTRRQDRRSILVVALIVAIVLMLLPLPSFLEPLRPYWVALVLVYWNLEVKPPLSLGGCFALGLLLDLLTGSLMGVHALSLVVMVYLVRHFRARIHFFPPWQQALSVLALLVNDRIIGLWISTLMGEPMPTWQYWLAPMMGMAIWPWLFLLLTHIRVSQRHAGKS